MLWRYSLGTPTWRAGTVTSVDYSTMVLGYAINYLPDNFYPTYAGLYKTEDTTTTTTGKLTKYESYCMTHQQ